MGRGGEVGEGMQGKGRLLGIIRFSSRNDSFCTGFYPNEKSLMKSYGREILVIRSLFKQVF